MEEPGRIGLTKETNAYLDEMLDELNPPKGKDGTRLIKFDLIRLAVAIGVRKGEKPPQLTGNTDNAFRIGELDPDKALFIAVEASGLAGVDEPVYQCIERLAEQGIKEFYQAYRNNMGKLPLEKLLV